MIDPIAVVRFWTDAGPKKWFAKDEAFDAELRIHFEGAHQSAARGALADWESTPEGVLALLLLTDQVPRNIYRGSAHAFATDAIAREAARRAIARGFDQRFEANLRIFFYLPFEHSEHIDDQDRGVALCEALGDEEFLRYARLHRDIIARFGRFPHRNAVMGRLATEEEKDYLAGGGFAG